MKRIVTLILGLILAVTLNGQAVHGIFASNAESYSVEYQAVYDQFSTTPSDADAAAQNTFVVTLVDGAVWSELDRLFILASHAAGADAVMDWIHPTGTAATLVNAPSFVAYQGYTGNGTSQYINTNYNPFSDGVKFTVDDCSIGAYIRGSSASSGAVDMGNTVGGVFLWMNAHHSSTQVQMPMNINLITETTCTDNTAGFTSIARGLATTATMNTMRDGVSQGTKQRTSIAIPNANMFLLCYSNSDSPGGYSTREQSMAIMGSKMSVAKHLILYNAFQALMTYYGTEVGTPIPVPMIPLFPEPETLDTETLRPAA